MRLVKIRKIGFLNAQNIFSTMLNFASLQKDVWSVFGKDLPEDRPSVLFTKKMFMRSQNSIFVFR